MGRASTSQRIRHDKQQAGQFDKAASTDLRTFLTTADYGQKRSSFERLVSSRAGRKGHDPVFLAEAHLEMAVMSSGEIQGFHLSSMAGHIRRAKLSAQHSADKVRVAILETNIPLIISAYIMGEHPSLDKIQQAYRRLSSEVAAAYQVSRAEQAQTVEPQKRAEFVGFASEAVALMMLQRFAVEQVASADYLPIPSLQSENHTAHRKEFNDTNWDISIFAGEEIADPTYRVQVKYGSCGEGRYAEGIDVVHMTALDGQDHYVTLGSLIVTFEDTVNSYRPLKNHVAQVDSRTNAMIDILG